MNKLVELAIELIPSYSEAEALNDISHDYLTLNITRSGREVIWLLSNEREVCIYTDTGISLNAKEIENELI